MSERKVSIKVVCEIDLTEDEFLEVFNTASPSVFTDYGIDDVNPRVLFQKLVQNGGWCRDLNPGEWDEILIETIAYAAEYLDGNDENDVSEDPQ